jgi:hypothetical protein
MTYFLGTWLKAMKRTAALGARARPGAKRRRPHRVALRLEALEDRTVPSTLTVTSAADDGSAGTLRAEIAAAVSGDTINFDPSLAGQTITLTSGELAITKSLDIEGLGANQLAVSGNGASRVFDISRGVTAAIDDLTISGGRAVGQGGGILNAGTLTLAHVIVSHNQVVGLPGAPFVLGGGIRNTGTLTVSDSEFDHNQAVAPAGVPGGPGGAGLGGAIMSSGVGSAPATATVSQSTFLDNQAIGGAAGLGASFTRVGLGGAIMNDAGTFTVSDSEFDHNQAVGGFGGGFVGGFGAGGAICNGARTANAILSVSDCTLSDNQAIGGAAGAGSNPQIGRGGGIANFVSPIATLPVTATATVTASTLSGNQAIGGDGPNGGVGQGGGIVNLNGGILTVTESVIALNQAIGGASIVGVGSGGTGQGGGIANLNGGVLTVSSSVIALNQAIGGASNSGSGGNGQGGGLFNGGSSPFGTSSLTLQGSLVVFNQAEGGAGQGGSEGLGQGGGLYLTPGGTACADLLTTIFGNHASTSDDDVFGVLGLC